MELLQQHGLASLPDMGESSGAVGASSRWEKLISFRSSPAAASAVALSSNLGLDGSEQELGLFPQEQPQHSTITLQPSHQPQQRRLQQQPQSSSSSLSPCSSSSSSCSSTSSSSSSSSSSPPSSSSSQQQRKQSSLAAGLPAGAHSSQLLAHLLPAQGLVTSPSSPSSASSASSLAAPSLRETVDLGLNVAPGAVAAPTQKNQRGFTRDTTSSSSSATLLDSPLSAHPAKSEKESEESKKDGGEWEQYNAGAAFLGPTLWDKTLSAYDSELKVSLEYMDLEEFLHENEIPVEENQNQNQKQRAVRNPAQASPVSNPPSSPDIANMSGPLTTQGPSAMSPQGGPQMGHMEALSPPSPPSPDAHSPLQVQDPEREQASQGRKVAVPINVGENAVDVIGKDDGLQYVEDLRNRKVVPIHVDFNISPSELALATVPGQDFDPRTRAFSEEELKPQPMIKKSRKQFVPVEMKDDKYWARRRKNNMAAKRSRDARRLKENQIAMRANFLEKENDALTAELDKAHALMESLKKRLSLYEAV